MGGRRHLQKGIMRQSIINVMSVDPRGNEGGTNKTKQSRWPKSDQNGRKATSTKCVTSQCNAHIYNKCVYCRSLGGIKGASKSRQFQRLNIDQNERKATFTKCVISQYNVQFEINVFHIVIEDSEKHMIFS